MIPPPRAAGPADGRGSWPEACQAIRARIGEANFETWIAPLTYRWDGSGVTLEAPERRTRDCVERHFLPEVEAALTAVLGQSCPVRVTLPASAPVLPVRGRPPAPGQTFGTFVVGGSNAEACAAARALAAGASLAPLFVTGPSGVGKTHLLHAVCHEVTARSIAVACLPAARLVEAMVGAYGSHRAGHFWRDLEPLQALLLDDVHSLAGQEALQDDFIDGLTAWSAAGRVLMLTSDRAGDGVPPLAARLRAAFDGGLMAVIEPPDPPLRLAILQQKARERGLELNPTLVARIAVATHGNVRRLEGVLTQLEAHVRFGRQVDDALVQELLPELRAKPQAPLDLERIVAETASAFRLPPRRLRGRSREPDTLLARQVAMYLARSLLRRSFVDLATAFHRDHTTVLHATRAVAGRLATDPHLASVVESIQRRLATGTG